MKIWGKKTELLDILYSGILHSPADWNNARSLNGDRHDTPVVNHIRYNWVKLGLNAAIDRLV